MGYTVIELPGLRGIRWVESGIEGYVKGLPGYVAGFGSIDGNIIRDMFP